MFCLIPGGNLKVISKCLQYLAKIGEDLSIDSKQDYLSFYTVNQSKTTFAVCKLKEIFFSSYECSEATSRSNETNIMCKVQLKAMLNIFRSLKEKKTEYCKISFDPNDTRLKIIFKYKNDVLITQRLHLLDGESTNLDYDLQNHANKISNTGSFYGHLFSNFQPTDADLTMEINKQKVLTRNYYKTFNNNMKGVRSQISSNRNEYTVYEINEETAITLSLKPFRAIVVLAETFDIPVSLKFDKGGDLFIIHLQSDTFLVDCVMSTVDPLGLTQTTTTVQVPSIARLSLSGKANDVRNDAQDHHLTQQEQEAIEDVDWDDNCDFINDVPVNKKQKLIEGNEKAKGCGKIPSDNKLMQVPINVIEAEDALKIVEDYGKECTQDSPRTGRIKNLFKKIVMDEPEEPFQGGRILAPNSDSD